MRKIILLALLALVVVAGVGWADTINVPADHTTIQAAITAAVSGDEIIVAAGTYQEQLYIDKDLSLTGAGSTLTIIEAPDVVGRTTFGITTWTSSPRTIDAVIGVVGATVDITGLKVDGRDTGPDNFYGIYFHESNGSVTYCEVAGVTYPTSPGAQRVLSMAFSHGTNPGPYTVNVSNNVVPSFQKGGIYVGGPDMVFTVNNNDIDANPSPSIAGNGIQLSYGATGTTNGNVVSGVGYTGSGWAGTGILLFESGDVTMTGDTVTDSQSGINYSDWRWIHAHAVPVNITLNDLTLTDNEWSFGAQLSGNEADLNVIMTDCDITGSTGDAVDIWGTDLDPWGGSYYTGWDNGDLNVTVDGLVVDDTAVDGIWTADLSGNLTNTVHGFSIRNSSFTSTVGNAVANNFTATIDAAENYWDDPGGPVSGLKAGGSRDSSPLISPAGFDLPEKVASFPVPGSLGDKAAGKVTGPIIVTPWYGLPLGTVPMIVGTSGTIQSAVDLANSGDTVTVAAGTYAENVSLNKPITLEGANAGVHPAVGTHPTETVGVRGPETILSSTHAIVPSADNITVDGFMFTGAGGRIVDTYADANYFHLTNCIFDIGVFAQTQGIIQFGGGSHTDLTLDFNLFQDEGEHTFYTGGGPYDRMNISWNRFNVMGDGLFWTATPLVDGVIQGNELDGTIGGVPGTGWGTFNAGKLGNVQIKDNWAHDMVYTPFQVGIIGGSITNNVIERIYPYPGYYGYCFQLWGGLYTTSVSDDVTVEDNIFRFNDVPGATLPIHGFDITTPDSGPGVDGTTIVFRNNQFLDGGVMSGPLALRHRGDSTKWADAIGNFWGDVSGPYHATLNPGGTGADVGDYVTFDPWLGMAGGSMVPVTTGPLNCTQTVTLTFNYTADEFTPDMFGYNAVVSATSGLIFGAVADLEPFGDVNNNFYAMSTGANQWTITGSTVGSPTYPVTGPVTGTATTGLFTIVFSATGSVVGDVVFDSLTLRDPNNAPIPVDLAGASITFDCDPPAAVTGITAAPGHKKVDVSWTHNLADVDHFEVYHGLWYDNTIGVSAYPEYDDQPGETVPVRPTAYGVFPTPAEWVQRDDGFVATTTFADDEAFASGRGVYYYEVFAVDAAGNGSPPAAANDRATNYWLGDVYGPVGDPTPNGVVNVFDIDVLGLYFGTSIALDGPGNHTDVGPTDDWSRVGIPLTDSLIDFEDLMVFSMNFGVVGPTKAGPAISSVVDLAWVRYDDGRQALRLVDGTGVKGLNVRADARISGVTAGDLLDAQSELTFLKNVGDNLDVSVAVTGVNVGFVGSGDLFVIDAESLIEPKDLTIKLRGHDNSNLKFRMDETTGTLTPRVFSLSPNYPNPFNPMTKISFSLPEAQNVKLAVYGIDGRKVATLVNEARGAGLHEVVWNGLDDTGRQAASGMYFYRIDAGPYSQVHKMTLMK